MNWIKASILTAFFSTAAMAMPTQSTPAPLDIQALPGAKLMMECDPTYVAMAKELSALTMIALGAAFNVTYQEDADKVTLAIEQMKTCEDFQQVYKSTLEVLTKMGFDFEAYVSEGKGREELNQLVELIRQLASGQTPD